MTQSIGRRKRKEEIAAAAAAAAAEFADKLIEVGLKRDTELLRQINQRDKR